jgi:glucan phosphorylase
MLAEARATFGGAVELGRDLRRVPNLELSSIGELGSARLRIGYVPNLDLDVGLTLVAGVDVWLNTPRPPHEASGTSGMKAAHNGVPSLSVLDGWWREGWVDGVTGWAVGP